MATLDQRSTDLEIAFEAPAEVRDALAAMGRTEDVRLAPGARRLAFACYANELIAVADLEIDVSASGPSIQVTSLSQLESTALREPHGLDFLDDDTLVVGNRAGGVAVFRLPRSSSAGSTMPIAPVDGGVSQTLDAPSSVAVRALGADGHEVLVCNNWTNAITRYALGANGALGAGEVVARKWLDLPDGLAISRDSRWLAVSNHNSHGVLVFAYSTLNEDADPVGLLRGVQYPHGLRFGPGDSYLLVADAGSPFVHVFVPPDSGWRGVGYPAATIRVMDDDTFARGRYNVAEGGPKGIDVDPGTNVLVVTSEHTPLAFFDVAAALERREVAEDVLVRYELHVLAEANRVKIEAAEAAAEARAQMTALQQTKAWRLLQPARRAYGAVLRLKPRLRRRRAPADS